MSTAYIGILTPPTDILNTVNLFNCLLYKN